MGNSGDGLLWIAVGTLATASAGGIYFMRYHKFDGQKNRGYLGKHNMGGFWKLGFMFNKDDGAAKMLEPASIDTIDSENSTKSKQETSVSDRLPNGMNADGLANTSNVI